LVVVTTCARASGAERRRMAVRTRDSLVFMGW
jgi:hypothetical protein